MVRAIAAGALSRRGRFRGRKIASFVSDRELDRTEPSDIELYFASKLTLAASRAARGASGGARLGRRGVADGSRSAPRRLAALLTSSGELAAVAVGRVIGSSAQCAALGRGGASTGATSTTSRNRGVKCRALASEAVVNAFAPDS